MKMRRNQGIIGLLIILVVAVIALGYFGFDVRKIIESPQVQKNLTYIWGIAVTFFSWIWHIIVFLFHSLVSFLKELFGGLKNWVS